MQNTSVLTSVSDDELLDRLTVLVRQSRRVESELVAHIGEVDARRLYAREATSSMFVYCTEVLHLSEHEAYMRIAVARASRRHPALIEMLRDGRLHLSGIAKLAPHLDGLHVARREEVLRAAVHRSKRQIEELVARLAPKPEVPATIRKLPRTKQRAGDLHDARSDQLGPDRVSSTSDAGCEAETQSLGPDRVDGVEMTLDPEQVSRSTLSPEPGPPTGSARGAAHDPSPGPPTAAELRQAKPSRPATVEPLAPDRFKVTFTAGIELRDRLDRLRSLMPGHDLVTIIQQAITEKLDRVEARRFAKVKNPRTSLGGSDTSARSRHIPAAVRRTVSDRDGDCCTFVGAGGQRCRARGDLEFHHDKPYALGGDRSPDNIRLLCRTHNVWLAEATFGEHAREGP